MDEEGELVSNNQFVAVLRPGESFVVPSSCYVRIERFSVLEETPRLSGQRVCVMAEVETKTPDRRTVTMKAAIASLIIGKDFDQSCDLVISPSDRTVLTILGTPVPLQMLYTKFPK